MDAAERDAGVTSAGLWRNRSFLALWAGQTASALGDRITTIALPITAIVLLRASPLELGALRAASYLPYLFLVLVAGTAVDRHRKKPVMVIADILRAILLLSVPIAAAIGALSMAQLLAVGFVVGAAGMAFDLAYRAHLPALVAQEELLDANTKLQQTQSIAGIVGPSVGGALIQWLTAPVAIVFDAISFALSASLFAFVSSGRPASTAARPRPAAIEMWHGIKFVLTHPILRAQLLSTGMFNFFMTLGSAVAMIYLIDDLRFGSASVGVIFSLGAPGALLGALITKPVVRRFGLGPSMVLSSSAAGLAVFLLPAAHGSGIAAATEVVASLFLLGLGNQVFNISVVTLAGLGRKSPDLSWPESQPAANLSHSASPRLEHC